MYTSSPLRTYCYSAFFNLFFLSIFFNFMEKAPRLTRLSLNIKGWRHIYSPFERDWVMCIKNKHIRTDSGEELLEN